MIPSVFRNSGTHSTSIFLTALVLVLAAAPGLAQGDPSIRDWGSPPGTPPPYTTPDIWVDNNGDSTQGIGEPSKGLINRLFGKVRNSGSSAVSNVQVTFAYAPYGLWGWSSFSDFKTIQTVTVPTLAAAGSAGDELTLEVPWDLTDTTEDNGGAWGGFTVGDFDHFCVWVRITFVGDADADNNNARNNFTQVPLVLGKSTSIRFMMANPGTQRAHGQLDLRGMPEGFEFTFGELEPQEFILDPGEHRQAVLTIHPPADAPHGLPPSRVDLGLVLDGEPIGGLSFELVDARQLQQTFPPSGGTLSPYLTGTYDLRGKHKTVLQLINPTGFHRRVLIALFDADEKPRKCLRNKLSPNDLLEIDLRRELGDGFGVVKVVSLSSNSERPEPGLVGYQRSFSRCFWCGERLAAESPLHAIPAEILTDDLPIIWNACR